MVACEPPPPPAPAVRFNAQQITVNGEPFWEHPYLGMRIRVPVSEGRVSRSDLFPSWYITLPRDLPTQPPANGDTIEAGMNISLRDAQNSGPGDPDRLQFQTAAELPRAPDETHPDWSLVFYRSPLSRPGVQGFGYWIPADPSLRAQDGHRLVILCLPQFGDTPTFPHRLLCGFEARTTARITAHVTFQGTYLPDWKRVYDLAMQTIEARVSAP